MLDCSTVSGLLNKKFATMKHLFSRFLILFASTLIPSYTATQCALPGDADVWHFTEISASGFTNGTSYNGTAGGGV